LDRGFYLELARKGLRFPIGVDLILHERPDPAAALREGELLGRVVADTARRFRTPLAISRLDLELERTWLLESLGVAAQDIAKFHFDQCPDDQALGQIREGAHNPLNRHLQAQIESIAYIAACTDLVPVGTTLGPFSLMTKLVADPITPLAMAGAGMTAEEDEAIHTVEAVLEMSTRTILYLAGLQIKAGARGIFVAEPAANQVFISPRQIEKGSDVFDRFVMSPNRRLRELLRQSNVDLILHCCGEMADIMVKKLAELAPAVFSLGSSRRLWEDATLVPRQAVLYGNLPSKQFFSDDLMPSGEVARLSHELLTKMREAQHPFILGSECDVLIVPGQERSIYDKVAVMMAAA